MLHVAPAIVIAAAVAATQPVPSRRPLAQNERRAAEAYVNESQATMDELFVRGGKLGQMVADVLRGREKNGDLARAEVKDCVSFVDSKSDSFRTKAAPKFREMSQYRKAFLDYLAWERQFFAGWVADTLKMLEDPKLGPDEKQRLFVERTQWMAVQENGWTLKVAASKDAVNAVLARQ